MGDEEHGSGERVERLFELLDRFEIEVVRRFVQHEQVRPVRHQQRERRPGALPGGQRTRRSGHVIRAEIELGEEPAGVGDGHPGLLHERLEERPSADEVRSRLLDLSDHHIRSGADRTLDRIEASEQQRQQRRLAAAVPTDDRHPIAEVHREIDRPQPEAAPLDHRPCRPGDDITAAADVGDREPQLPGVARLLHILQTLDRALGARCAAGELLGLVRLEVPDVLVGLVRPGDLGLTLLRPLTLALGPLGERPAFRVVLVEPLLRVMACALTLLEERRPAAGEPPAAMSVVIDLEHVGDHPSEQAPIVADEQHRRVEADHPRFEAVESVEVEVVGRLVEQEDVEARQQQRGQRAPGRLATGQRCRRPIEEPLGQSEFRPRLADARVEIRGAQCEPPLQGDRVPIVAARSSGGEIGGRLVEFGLRGRDAGTPGEEPTNRLVPGGIDR